MTHIAEKIEQVIDQKPTLAEQLELGTITQEEYNAKLLEEAKQKAFDEKCAAIKAKHPKSFVLIVDDKAAFVNAISRKIISMAQTVSNGDEVNLCELILDACWIEGDDEIRDDDDYFIPAMAQIQGLLTLKTASLKKL